MEDNENGNFDKKTRCGSKNDRSKQFFTVVKKKHQSELSDVDQLQDIDENGGEPVVKGLKGTKIKKQYECCLCRKTISSRTDNLFVLTSHIQSCHPSEYATSVDIKPNLNKQQLAKTEFLQNCVECVAINGWPFAHLNSSGFKKIIQPKLKELSDLKCNINMDDPHFPQVKEYMKSTNERVKIKLQEEVKNTPVSVMIDIATCRDRSILGVSIQYLFNDQLKIACIGMIDVNFLAHTAKNIKSMLKECLEEYKISHGQVISITSDNAANMLAMSNLFTEEDANEDDDDLQEDLEIPMTVVASEGNLDEVLPYQDFEIWTVCTNSSTFTIYTYF